MIVLVPEGAELTENVTVTTDTFEGMEAAAASERSLNKAELQSTSMVLVGDALGAAQSLPGVVANNDLRADFTVRGATPEHVAVIVDGVLTDNFVHTFAGADSSVVLQHLGLAIGIREDVGLITHNRSRFVPHLF